MTENATPKSREIVTSASYPVQDSYNIVSTALGYSTNIPGVLSSAGCIDSSNLPMSSHLLPSSQGTPSVYTTPLVMNCHPASSQNVNSPPVSVTSSSVYGYLSSNPVQNPSLQPSYSGIFANNLMPPRYPHTTYYANPQGPSPRNPFPHEHTGNRVDGVAGRKPFTNHLAYSNSHTYIDSASFHLIKQNLLKRSETPYKGEPHLFQAFIHQTLSKIKGLPLDAWDIISILDANTSDRPNQVVKSFIIHGSNNAVEALGAIEAEFFRKFGASSNVASSIMQKLNSFQTIRSTHDTQKLEQLFEICRLIDTNMPMVRDLVQFNLPSGISLIWAKLPENLQGMWRSQCYHYKVSHCEEHPNFKIFLDFFSSKLMRRALALVALELTCLSMLVLT